MKKLLTVPVLALCLLLAQLGLSSAQAPDAVIELSGGSVAIGIGYSWGSGTLVYRGKRYPISVEGLSVGSVGATSTTATGRVYHLHRLADFSGNYAAVGVGATVGGGGDVSTMKNQHGVVINMGSTTRGLKVDVAASGVKMKIKG